MKTTAGNLVINSLIDKDEKLAKTWFIQITLYMSARQTYFSFEDPVQVYINLQAI